MLEDRSSLRKSGALVLLEKHISLISCVLQDIQILILKPQSDPYAHLSIFILILVLVFVPVRVPVCFFVRPCPYPRPSPSASSSASSSSFPARRLLMIYMNIELNFPW